MFVWLLVLVPTVWIVTFWYRRRHMYKLASVIPGPEDELPCIGIAHTLVGDTEKIMKQLQHFSYVSMKNDGIMKGWLGHILYFVPKQRHNKIGQVDNFIGNQEGCDIRVEQAVERVFRTLLENVLRLLRNIQLQFVVVNPMDLEMVLKHCLEKDDLHRFIRKIIGYGGIFAPVSIWRRRRKIMVPVFSPKIIENFVYVFAEQSERLVKQLTKHSGKGKFSIWPFLSSYTLDSVCKTTIGVEINAQENPDSPFLNSMSRVLNLVCARIFHLWLQPDWMYRLFPQYKKHQECIAVLHDFTDEVIEKKREELKLEKESKTEVDHEFDLGSYKSKTFLDLLIQLSGGKGEKGYTNEELREEVLTLTVAGTDTSAVALGYTLQLLGKYPEVQEKVYQELCEVFSDDRQLVKEDLTKLKYLERVVKESMRLFPPVPLIIRKVLEDITLPSGRVLPAGSGVVCSIWGAHRDPKYWGPDAEKFDPDRFLPERFNLKNPCSYMPFSNGPRNCVGYQYALMSVKTALSTIMRRYKVVEDREDGPIPKIRVKLDVMMKAVDGYQLALERRDVPT